MLIAGLFVALTLAQTPAPATAGRQEAPKTDETVPVQKGTRLSINNFAGEVVIHTWDKDSVHVVARHQSRTKVIIKPNAAGLSINATGTTGPQGSVDYDITAPAWMPIKVEGTYNFITMEGVQGEVFANSVRGDIIIKGGTGTITAKSIEGEVQVEGARGKVNVSSVNEKIRITDTSGEITAESTNGAITMTGIDSKSVDASTVNGTIIYEGKLADGGRYSFGTHNGDLLLGVPENANATFTIRTYQGSFQTDLPLPNVNRDDIQRGRRVVTTLGSGSADVSLETFGGAIRVRRGTATRRAREKGATGRTPPAAREPAEPSPGRAEHPAGAATARSGRARPQTFRLPDGHPEM